MVLSDLDVKIKIRHEQLTSILSGHHGKIERSCGKVLEVIDQGHYSHVYG